MINIDPHVLYENLRNGEAAAVGIREKMNGNLHPTYNGTAKSLQDVPLHMDADELWDVLVSAGMPFDSVNVRAVVDDVVARAASEELAELEEYQSLIQIVWKRNTTVKLDRAVLGSVSLFPKKSRVLWRDSLRPAPWWTLTLSLQAWLGMTQRERMRLVHHELMHMVVDVDADGHPKPALRGHDVEENLTTLARFGASGDDQAKFAAIVTQHPSWDEVQRKYDIKGGVQAGLFPAAWGQE